MTERAKSDGAPICHCENTDRLLFIWRGDPEWWSCVQCEGRVRPITEAEHRQRQANREAFMLRGERR